MATESQANAGQKQVYDNVFKRVIEGQFQEIIPLLFSRFQPIEIKELTIEVLIPPRRMDRAYLITTHIGQFILHIEIETAPKGRGRLSKRMLIYHALLLEKYNENDEDISVPVISYVVYPFAHPRGEARIREEYASEEQLRFCYHDIPLKSLDAHLFIEHHAVPLYGLLPAMDGLSEELLQNAITDMLEYYQSREDTDHLRDELLCFQTLLQRAKRLPEVQIENVLRRIRMFDPFLEEDPWVQSYGQRLKAEGKEEGKEEGHAERLRLCIKQTVRARFSNLEELAVKLVEHTQDLDALQKTFVNLLEAQDEYKARYYLQALENSPQYNA